MSRNEAHHDHGLRVAVGSDDNIGAGAVHDIARRGLDLSQQIRAGGQVGNANFAVAVCCENAILGQCAGADHAVQTDLTARRRGDTELGARKGLAGDAVPLLDNNATFR